MASINKLVYSKYGEPSSVVELISEPAHEPTLKPNEALVRVLYSPVNPADVYTIMGGYPVKPPLPAVAGMEGVVEVIKGNRFQPGDRAIVLKLGWGHWTQQAVIEEEFLTKIPQELPLEAAATLIINPCTAYLMLKDIVQLAAGDVVIQNAANSVVGLVVIQLAKAAGIKTINVIRNRPNLQETVDKLKSYGADAVITSEELENGLEKLNLGLPKPKLGLDCIGGKAARDIGAALSDGATLVVYGVLSGEPVHVGQGELIFRGIHTVGFWITRWTNCHSKEQFAAVVSELVDLYKTNRLQLPNFRKFQLAEWQEAVKFAMQGFTNEKVLLQLNEPSTA